VPITNHIGVESQSATSDGSHGRLVALPVRTFRRPCAVARVNHAGWLSAAGDGGGIMQFAPSLDSQDSTTATGMLYGKLQGNRAVVTMFGGSDRWETETVLKHPFRK